MYYKVEQVLEKQQAVTENYYKGRGILICETDCGLFALKEFRGQNQKAEYLFRLGSYLTEHHISCDCMVKNKEDRLITEGVDGTKYTFHHWVKGRECDAKSRMDLVMAVSFLAGFHRACERGKIWDGVSIIERLNTGRDLKDLMEGTANTDRGLKDLMEGTANTDRGLKDLMEGTANTDRGLKDLMGGTANTDWGLKGMMEGAANTGGDSKEAKVYSYRESEVSDNGKPGLRQGMELTNAPELQRGSASEPRRGSASESRTGNTPEPQSGSASEPRTGNMSRQQIENASEPRSGSASDSRTGNMSEPRVENAPETAYEEYCRRDRELRRIKKYITSRKNKSNFELLYLQCFPEYIRQSDEVLQFLSEHQEIFDNHTMGVCHGDFNQHNVVIQSGGMALIHMEHAHYGAQVEDLGNFLRKSLEKHAWSETLGLEMLREYERIHSLNESDWLELYCRMSYPEKFWKIANRYYQSNKVLDSGLNYEKLKKELRQNEVRRRFLKLLRRVRVEV